MPLLKTLLRTKVGLLTLALLLLGSGGTALAMTAAQGPMGQLGGSLATTGSTTSGSPTHTSGAQDQDHDGRSANHLAVEGTLVAASTTAIKVQDEAKTWTITVNASTKINGKHATTLADMVAAVGQKVQVQADKQSDGSFLASKVTVQGAETGEHGQSGEHGDGEHGQSGQSGEHGQSQDADSAHD